MVASDPWAPLRVNPSRLRVNEWRERGAKGEADPSRRARSRNSIRDAKCANDRLRAGNLKTRVQTVQSHDMLYALSLDILYTSARGARVGGERWRGRRWTSRNNGDVLLLRPPEARRGLAPFVQSLGSQSTHKMPAMATISMMAHE